MLTIDSSNKMHRYRKSSFFLKRYVSSFVPAGPDRRHAGSLRFDRFAKRKSDGTLEYGDLLAMWVADMDFRAPENIIRRLEARSRDGVFGYPAAGHADDEAILNYLVEQHGCRKYDASSLVYLPGLVVGLNVCARAFAKQDEAVMMATPVYPPFFLAPAIQHRPLSKIPLVFHHDSNTWTLDMQAIRKRVDESPSLPRVKVFFLCNPHNPVGKVFTKEELVELLEFCKARDILVVSDEIHCDLLLNGKHVTCAGLGYDDNLVVLHAPSKTFNLAGIGAAFALIPNPDVWRKFKHECRGIVADVSIFGFTAMRAAYGERESWEWQRGLVDYLRGNRDFLCSELKRVVPSIQFDASRHNATYLAWLDCSRLMKGVKAKSEEDANNFKSASSMMLKTVNLAVNDGNQFYGSESEMGRDFVRLNFACHRDRLAEAIQRMGKIAEKYTV